MNFCSIPERAMVVFVAISLVACGAFKPKKDAESKEKPTLQPPKLVGRIASIPPGKRFVLIQSYEKRTIEQGTILTTRGPEERTANLLATGESLGQFVAADLQSGLVEVGDAVYSRHVPKPTTPSESPTEPPSDTAPAPELPENQEKSISENVQKNN